MQYRNSYDFPHRMNVSTDGAMSMTPNTNNFINYKTGKPTSYTPPSNSEAYAALQRYLAVLERYEDMVLPGFFKFPDPASIPEDLLMPFVDFVKKYNLEAAVPTLWDATAMGLGDTMNVPTVWVMQACGAPFARALLGLVPSVVPPSGRIYDLYEAVAKFLGKDVLYSSTVVSATRPTNLKQKVSLKVKNNKGAVTCVEAKRLLIAIEPTPENMAPFNLDKNEQSVLFKFQYPTVYAAVLRHPSLQPLNAYSNRVPSAAQQNNTEFPVAPQLGRIEYIGGTEDLFLLTAVGTAKDTTESMKDLVNKQVNTMICAGTLPATGKGKKVAFPMFSNHGKMHAHVSADELRGGFLQKLYALQGPRNTWYTGAAFSAGFSTVLWEFNKELLPKVVEGL
jgi:hypothetical protein